MCCIHFKQPGSAPNFDNPTQYYCLLIPCIPRERFLAKLHQSVRYLHTKIRMGGLWFLNLVSNHAWATPLAAHAWFGRIFMTPLTQGRY